MIIARHSRPRGSPRLRRISLVYKLYLVYMNINSLTCTSCLRGDRRTLLCLNGIALVLLISFRRHNSAQKNRNFWRNAYYLAPNVVKNRCQRGRRRVTCFDSYPTNRFLAGSAGKTAYKLDESMRPARCQRTRATHQTIQACCHLIFLKNNKTIIY
jgi:hypothetical protein